ncbi:MAG: rhamnulokinase [Victivallaceae bacterium]|nr:rhamnulokinase [Victivallaceae bacterium]
MCNYLAVDIGAGSGRIIHGSFDGSVLVLDETFRFTNAMRQENGHCRWDVEALFAEILKGLEISARQLDAPPDSIGIDTWGCDYVLLDENDRIACPVSAYRDSRTDGLMEKFFSLVPKRDIYAKTGIQFLQFNTLYQLWAARKNGDISRAKRFLMIPDYLNFRLTGIKANEYSNATTTQLLNSGTCDWDGALLAALGIDRGLFERPRLPGTVLGPLLSSVQEKTGLPAVSVILPATHDTGSAVAAVPAEGRDWAYISSGTWSLMGIETKSAVCSEAAREYNFTNEGGVAGTFRLLKNIMGLWLVRGLKNGFTKDYSYTDLENIAREAEPFRTFIDVNNPGFLNPECMKTAIDEYCLATGQRPPQSDGAYVRCALEGLGFLYKETLEQLRDIQKQEINRIHVIGGGCQDKLLCQITADATGLPVLAGPCEGTAAGNLIVQAIALGHIKDPAAARKIIADSFEIDTYKPGNMSAWNKAWRNFQQIRSGK